MSACRGAVLIIQHSQVVSLIERDALPLAGDMGVILTAHPANRGAVERGAGPDVCLQGREWLGLLDGQSDLRSLEGQNPVALRITTSERERCPVEALVQRKVFVDVGTRHFRLHGCSELLIALHGSFPWRHIGTNILLPLPLQLRCLLRLFINNLLLYWFLVLWFGRRCWGGQQLASKTLQLQRLAADDESLHSLLSHLEHPGAFIGEEGQLLQHRVFGGLDLSAEVKLRRLRI